VNEIQKLDELLTVLQRIEALLTDLVENGITAHKPEL
jgi:hypothetical protein